MTKIVTILFTWKEITSDNDDCLYRTARATAPTSSAGSSQSGHGTPNVKTRKSIRGNTKLKRAAKVLKKPVDATSDLFNTVISKTSPS